MNRQKKIDEFNFPYTFNPYTGCSYGCLYCYSIKSTIWSARLKNWGIKPNQAKPKDDVVKRLRSDLESLDNIEQEFKEVQIGNFFDAYPPMYERYYSLISWNSRNVGISNQSTGENTKNTNRNISGISQEYLTDDVLKMYGGKKESKFITS